MERGHFSHAIQRPMIRLGVFAVCVAFVWLVILSALNTTLRYAVFPVLVLGGWMALGLLIRTFWGECLPLLRDLQSLSTPGTAKLKNILKKLYTRVRTLRSAPIPLTEQPMTLPPNPENHV